MAMTNKGGMNFSGALCSSRPAPSRRWFVCAFAFLVLCAAGALAQDGKGGEETMDSVLTSAGMLSIVRVGEAVDFNMELRLGGKKVYAVEGNMHAGFKAHFRELDSGEVVVLWVGSGGSACPAQFQFIRVEAAGKVIVTEEFGDCSDSPTITLQLLPDEQISLRFPGYYRLSQLEEPGFQKPPPTTWVYKAGVLKQLKAAPPKRRGK
ncbi:MAG: hypothetical protein H7Z38_04190 [Rubrivivax sp.]|nr:hypothetical protein [Pyrinomonadaceae bacterium]